MSPRLTVCLLAVAWLHAAPPPQLQSVFPLAVSRNATTEITVRGTELDVAGGALFDCSYLTATFIAGEPGKAVTQARLQLKVSPSTRTGAHALRLYSKWGISNPVVVMVVAEPNVTAPDLDAAGDAAHPHPLTLPAVVNSRIAAKDRIDYFAVDLAAGRPVQLEIGTASGYLRGAPPFFPEPQLILYETGGSWFDATRLRRVEAANESFLFYFPPSNNTVNHRRPRYLFHPEKAGRYLLAVRSANGAGSPHHAYVLRALPLDDVRPAPSRWLPTAMACTDPGAWEERAFDRPLSFARLEHIAARAVPMPGPAKAKPLPDPPLLAENEPDEVALPIPAIVDGAIDTPGDVDTYRLTARAGERLVIELETPADAFPYFSPHIGVKDSSGRRLFDNIYRKIGGDGDDWIKSIESKVTYTFEKAGEYTLEVRDLTQRGHSPLFRYRLGLRSQIPHFGELAAKTFGQNSEDSPEDRINLTPGQVRKLQIVTAFEEGFDGDVAVSFENLPAGIEVLPLAGARRDILSAPGESHEALGADRRELYRPPRTVTSVLLRVPNTMAPMSEPRLIRPVGRAITANRVGKLVPGQGILFMVVPPSPPDPAVAKPKPAAP